jgi:hypothetical protein
MNTSQTHTHLNENRDFGIERLIFPALFVVGITLLLILTPAADSGVNASSDNKVITKSVGLKGPAGKTPTEMGPEGKNKSPGKADQQSRALPSTESISGDEDQPYYIPSPDL